MLPMKPIPALVYADPSARDDVNEYLQSQNWYRLDDLQETETDLTRPSEERPILHRIMVYASTHGAVETQPVEDGRFVGGLNRARTKGPDWPGAPHIGPCYWPGHGTGRSCLVAVRSTSQMPPSAGK
jgi:hypothetical protein